MKPHCVISSEQLLQGLKVKKLIAQNVGKGVSSHSLIVGT